MKKIVTLSTIVFISFSLYAAELKNFTPGTPAKAEEVNSNFQVLLDEINALKSEVAKLNGDESTLSGEYTCKGYQTQVHGGINAEATAILAYVILLDLNFLDTGNYSGTLNLKYIKNSYLDATGDAYEMNLTVDSASGGISGTWSNNSREITLSDFDFTFKASKSYDTLIGSSYTTTNDPQVSIMNCVQK